MKRVQRLQYISITCPSKKREPFPFHQKANEKKKLLLGLVTPIKIGASCSLKWLKVGDSSAFE